MADTYTMFSTKNKIYYEIGKYGMVERLFPRLLVLYKDARLFNDCYHYNLLLYLKPRYKELDFPIWNKQGNFTKEFSSIIPDKINVWELELSETEIEKIYSKIKTEKLYNSLKPVISLSAAAKLIHMDRSNFWRIVDSGEKFTNKEAYQVGKLWFITMEGLKRVYGDRMKEE